MSFDVSCKVTIGLLNWVAPASLKNEDFELQANLAATIIQNNPANIVAMLNPQFTYRRGQLWMTEEMVMKTLGCRPIHLDKKFALTFSSKVDTRDTRPLLYDGRLLTAPGVTDNDHFFKASPLFMGSVQPAKMLKSSQMVTVEDCSGTALPGTTDVDGCLQGAAKFQQVGCDAWVKILDAALENINFGGRGALIIFELNFGVGNGFDAFIEKQRALNLPAFYCTVLPDAKTAEWFHVTKVEELKKHALDGKLVVPGCQPVSKDVPHAVLEAAPAIPKMNKLVAQPPVAMEDATESRGATLSLPQALLDEWLHHPTYGTDFRKWADSFHEEFEAYAPKERAQAADFTPRKRPGILEEPQSQKKRRSESVKFIDAAAMNPTSEAFSVCCLVFASVLHVCV